jgi:hypothetical protein
MSDYAGTIADLRGLAAHFYETEQNQAADMVRGAAEIIENLDTHELVALIDAKVKGCRDCPHTVGDATERDCCFPDCHEISYEDALTLIYEIRTSLTQGVTA